MRRYGWIPDYPDFRDYSEENEKIVGMLAGLKKSKKELMTATGLRAGTGGRTEAGKAEKAKEAKETKEDVNLPGAVDLCNWCSPVEDQGDIGSCTAHAVAGIVEYSENRAYGKYINTSRLFLYKVTRNLLHYTGDTGAFLRSTIGAMVLFGSPPEEYCPYDTQRFDTEPSSFCYAFGQNYRLIKYFRHDLPAMTKKETLESVKKYLAMGIPSVFGFTVYQSISETGADGRIPFPEKDEKVVGGHAVAAVGYDDDAGAVLIRNSWGAGWGVKGYGWLPYEYILKGMAVDWWSVIKQDWVDTGLFSEM